jgi:hypothetical protein
MYDTAYKYGERKRNSRGNLYVYDNFFLNLGTRHGESSRWWRKNSCGDQQSTGVSVSGGISCSDSEAIMKLHMRFT